MSRASSTWRFPAVLWRAFHYLKLPSAAVLHRAGLPEAIAIDPRHELNTDQAFAIWDAVEALAQDPLFGFKLMKAASRVGTDTTFLAATRAATFKDALDSYIRTRRLHSPARIAVKITGDTVGFFRHIPDAVRPEPSVAVDFTLGTLLALGRVGTAHGVAAARVELTRPGPQLPFHRTFYGGSVRYGAPQNAIFFTRSDLELPLVSHDVEAEEALTISINTSIAERAAAEAIDDAVRAAIRQVMIVQQPDLASVAKRLGLSERSLQRKIAEQGSTFSRLLATVRWEMAKTLLAVPTARIDVVARQLRYADTATFHRAFRNWEGISPARWKGKALLEQRLSDVSDTPT